MLKMRELLLGWIGLSGKFATRIALRKVEHSLRV